MAEGENEIPFDMTKETLKSIRDWIDKIAVLSVGILDGNKINLNDMISTKQDMVEILIMISSVMMKEEDLEEIEEYFSNIKMRKGDVRTADGWARGVVIYSKEANGKLDECVKGVQKALRKYFVPEFKNGERY